MSAFPLPTVSPPTLSNFQMSFGGLTVGQGTPYGVLAVDGLDLPPIGSGDVARPRDTGEFEGLDLLRGRTVTLTLDASGSGSSIQTVMQTFAAAFAPPSDGQTETPLWVQYPNLPLLCVSGRVRKRQVPIDVAWGAGAGFAQKILVQLQCTDPRVYAPTQSPSVTLPAPPGGLTFPATFPLSFGGGSSAGTITLNNTGDIETRPIVVINGPVTSPTIQNQTTGALVTIKNPNQVGFTIQTGEKLWVDMDQHEVYYYSVGSSIGSARRSWVVAGSTWWDLAPGTSVVAFSSQDASLPSPAPTCSVYWAPAYSSLT